MHYLCLLSRDDSPIGTIQRIYDTFHSPERSVQPVRRLTAGSGPAKTAQTSMVTTSDPSSGFESEFEPPLPDGNEQSDILGSTLSTLADINAGTIEFFLLSAGGGVFSGIFVSQDGQRVFKGNDSTIFVHRDLELETLLCTDSLCQFKARQMREMPLSLGDMCPFSSIFKVILCYTKSTF